MDTNISNFDKEIKKFFDLCSRILEENKKYNLNSSKNTNVYRNYQRYVAVYGGTKTEKHMKYLRNFYLANKSRFLTILTDDNWLADGCYEIQYGTDITDPELAERAKKRKINLSFIYDAACRIRDKTDDSLKDLPDAEAEELFYPDFFLLHLYRLFTLSLKSKPEQEELSKIISTLESELGEIPEPTSQPSGIAGLMKNLFSGLGNLQNLQANVQLPTETEINTALTNILGNNDLSKQLSSQFGNVLQSKSLAEGLTKAMTVLQDPKFNQNIAQAVNNIVPKETMETIQKTTENLKLDGDFTTVLSSLTEAANKTDLTQVLNGTVSSVNLISTVEQLGPVGDYKYIIEDNQGNQEVIEEKKSLIDL